MRRIRFPQASWVINATRLVFMVLIAVAFICAVCSPDLYLLEQLPMRIAFCAMASMLIITFALIVKPIRERVARLLMRLLRGVWAKIVPVTVAVALLALTYQATLIILLAPAVDADIGTLFANASGFDNLNVFNLPNYFSYYSNNLFILFVMKGLSSAVNVSTPEMLWKVWDLYNAFCIDLALVLLFFATRRIYGKKAAYLTLYLGIAIIAMTPRVMTPYTDTGSLPFSAAAILMLVQFKGERTLVQRLFFGFGFGFFSALCYLMKPSAFIFFIAVVLVIICTVLSHPRQTFSLFRVALVLVVAIGLVLPLAGFNAYKEHQDIIEIKPELQLPSIHFAMMGLTGKGGWNREDVLTLMSLPTVEARQEYAVETIKTRLKAYGIVGYSRFLASKYFYNTSDGSFALHRGGDTPFIDDSQPANALDRTLRSLYYPDGDYLQVFRLHAQLLWLLLLASLLLSYREKGNLTTILRLAVIGGLVFLLLFEGGRTRYLIQFLPYMLILGSIGLQRMIAALGDYAQRVSLEASSQPDISSI
jgi:integral membrane protein (TIGR03766 family)